MTEGTPSAVDAVNTEEPMESVEGEANTRSDGEAESTEVAELAEAGTPSASENSEKSASSEESDEGGRTEEERIAALEREGDIAADYLEELLDIADLDGDIDLDVEADRALVAVVGEGLDHLVGKNGDALEALQELTRLAVLRQTGERSRLMLDVSGYRERRREELVARAEEAVEKVRSTGRPVRLEPMRPFERKVIHDAIAESGLLSESEGEEPQRRVVIRRRK